MNITPIIETVFALIAAVITAIVIPYIRSKTTAQQQTVTRMSGLSDDKLREHLYDAVERVVVYDTETIEIVWKFNESKIDTDENIGVAN